MNRKDVRPETRRREKIHPDVFHDKENLFFTLQYFIGKTAEFIRANFIAGAQRNIKKFFSYKCDNFGQIIFSANHSEKIIFYLRTFTHVLKSFHEKLYTLRSLCLSHFGFFRAIKCAGFNLHLRIIKRHFYLDCGWRGHEYNCYHR